MSVGWQLRPATAEDLPEIVEIIRTEEMKYRGRTEVELDVVRQFIAADTQFDPARDQVVADVDGQIVAAAVVNPRTANLTVHPDHEQVALRAELLRWTERRQSELGREAFRIGAPATHGPALAVLSVAGYEIERFYALMVRDFEQTGPPEPATVPDGYRLRPIDPARDVGALHALNERAFGDRPDHRVESTEEYDARGLSISIFAPEWSWLVETGSGEIAGSLIAWTMTDASTGYVALLAVNPDHRRRGVARTLLLASFAAIQAAGCTKAELHVASDNPKALDLYTGVGMSQSERFDDFVRVPG